MHAYWAVTGQNSWETAAGRHPRQGPRFDCFLTVLAAHVEPVSLPRKSFIIGREFCETLTERMLRGFVCALRGLEGVKK